MSATIASTAPLRRAGRRAVPWRRVRIVPLVGGLVATVLVAGVLAVVLGATGGPSSRTIRAVFAQAPGLYKGNHVEVLGMPVGTITSIRPSAGGVTVTMQVDDSVRIPAGADAVLDAPQVVNDRYVELTPVYTGGPTMPAGTTIPLTRTAYPLSVDQVLASLDSLLSALGPTAQNDKGVLSSLINQLNAQLNGQGEPLHETIGNASSAASGLAADAPALSTTLTQLSSFVATLAADSNGYTQFTSALAGAAGDLDAERTNLGAALSTLQQTLAQVTAFITRSGSTLGATITNLDAAAKATAAQQQSLGQALQILPLTGQNLDNTVGLDYLGGGAPRPVANARVTVPSGSQTLIKQVCGSVVLRTAALVAQGAKAPVLDPICSFSAAASQLTTPPGTPTDPDLTLAAMLAATR